MIIAARKNCLTNCRSIAILNAVMTYSWLIENLIKEYARHNRSDGTSLDDYLNQLCNAVRNELEINTLDERTEEYNRHDSWDDDAGA